MDMCSLASRPGMARKRWWRALVSSKLTAAQTWGSRQVGAGPCTHTLGCSGYSLEGCGLERLGLCVAPSGGAAAHGLLMLRKSGVLCAVCLW
jgi:hypothetical protein